MPTISPDFPGKENAESIRNDKPAFSVVFAGERNLGGKTGG
jgi:hypothetical protein